MNITVHNNKARIIIRKEILPAIKKIEEDYEKIVKGLGIILLSDEKLREMNVRYLKSGYYTDIISFTYTEIPNEIEGELYISIDRIRENAKKFKITAKEELYRVIIHGILHLAGEDDGNEEQKEQMQVKENQYLKFICFT
jgi:rRNA maturation RNase YbeY